MSEIACPYTNSLESDESAHAYLWIEAAVTGSDDPHVQSRSVDGSTVLVMRTHDRAAVIMGDATTALLWRTAGTVEAQSEAG